jgi:hypothetical protein
VQKEFGVHNRGSYVVSVKNPKYPGPGNASIKGPAQYPESVAGKFKDLRWIPLEPELLDYDNTQLLLIGEGQGDLGKAVAESSQDQQDERKEAPEEEIAKLEDEVSLLNEIENEPKLINQDHHRVTALKEDDPVFADLGLSSKEYSTMQTTW